MSKGNCSNFTLKSARELNVKSNQFDTVIIKLLEVTVQEIKTKQIKIMKSNENSPA